MSDEGWKEEGWKIAPETEEENFYSTLMRAKGRACERVVYDPYGPLPGPPEPAWRRWLQALRDRLRYLPARVWWAFFGDDYWDSGW